MRSPRPSFGLLLVAGVGWLLAAPRVAADCEPAGPLEQVLPKADVAFVGTVTALDGPIATFAVREVWAGEVADTVSVRGFFEAPGGRGAAGEAPFGEDDRSWMAGETYLVVPWVDRGVLRDSICTATTEWSDELAALRPADARFLARPDPGSVSIPGTVIVVGTVILVIAGASALAFRRR